MRQILKVMTISTVLVMSLFFVDYFNFQGRYMALLTSSVNGFFANSYKEHTLKVAVISDKSFQQQDRLIAVVKNSFEQFKQLGINFQLVDWQVESIPFGYERAVAKYSKGEYTIILTAKDPSEKAEHQWGGMAGWADPQSKLVVLGIKNRDMLTSPRLVSTLQHELGHLFYAEHDEASEIFVMSPVVNSSLAWSPEASNVIRKMRYRN